MRLIVLAPVTSTISDILDFLCHLFAFSYIFTPLSRESDESAITSLFKSYRLSFCHSKVSNRAKCLLEPFPTAQVNVPVCSPYCPFNLYAGDVPKRKLHNIVHIKCLLRAIAADFFCS